ncbi:Putative esterase [Ruminococcaceae bacterium KH2T8]|nr:Putative esterase [Ruminococcaceae bacterium KH2T8]
MNNRRSFARAVVAVMTSVLLLVTLSALRGKETSVYADQVIHYGARRTVTKQLPASESMTYYVIEPEEDGTYPVVIMFHGMGGVGDVADLENRANNWMASGTLDPVVFVVPDIGANTGDKSHHFNKSPIGNTGKSKLDFLIDDILDGTASSKIDDSVGISVAGFSLGGCSSLDAGIRRNDVIINVGAFSSSSLFYPNPPYTVNWGWYQDQSQIVYSSDANAHRFLTASAVETTDGNPYTSKKTVEFYASIMPEQYAFTTYIFSSGIHNSDLMFRELYMYLYYIQNDVLPTEEQCRSATFDDFSSSSSGTSTSTSTSSTTVATTAETTPSTTSATSAPAATTAATTTVAETTVAPTETTSAPDPVAPAAPSSVLSTTRSDVSVNYSTHVQNIGWQDYVYDGAMAGTEGRSLRLEAMAINVESDLDLGVRYKTHVQNVGWQDWFYNGDSAGTSGQSLRLEGMQIKIVRKGEPSNFVSYNTHVQNIGWQSYVTDGVMAGTTGQSLRLEGIHISVDGLSGVGVQYRTHIQNIGWEENWSTDGEFSGTEGQSLRLEAIEIELTGENADQYDIYYRTHVQNFGWTGWASNGASCGSAGYAYRLEGIEILIVPAGTPAPGSTANAFYQA